MGRIKTRRLKAITENVFEENPEAFKTDFEENKRVVSGLISTQSKKLRNIIAGYSTRLKKRSLKQ